MHYRTFLAAGLLLAACSPPDHPAETRAPAPRPPARAASLPDTVAGYAFLRQTMRLSVLDALDVRADDGWFFSRFAYGLDAGVAEKLAPATNPDEHTIRIGGFQKTPAPVLREFRQQIGHLDAARQRHFRWDSSRLGQFVFVDSTGATLRPELAGQVRGAGPAQQARIQQAIAEWNRSPRAERFISYASQPLFSASGRYALVVRGQAQQSIGWDSIFIYERTATGWKILESVPITTI